jgi:Domain of unknown function (DUF305)
MPGMLRPAEIEQLRRTNGAAFDPLFVDLMTRHTEVRSRWPTKPSEKPAICAWC